MMFLFTFVFSLCLWQSGAFTFFGVQRTHGLLTTPHHASVDNRFTTTTTTTALSHSYVPDGLTSEQYHQIKTKERQRLAGKDLGRLGPQGFQSRSLQAWQVAYEHGQVSHTFAPLQYQQQMRSGTLRPSDIPYMVRGGAWDNSDLKGVKRLPWNALDRNYAKGGYKKEQSASILGSGPGLNWTGSRTFLAPNTSKRNMPGFS